MVSPSEVTVYQTAVQPAQLWILRARDRDRDILARLRFGHQRPVNRRCPDEKYQYVNNNRLTEYPGTLAWTPATSKSRVSNAVSQDIQSICYCLHTGIFSSGHLRFTGRWCLNLNLIKISLSLSHLKSTHTQLEWGTGGPRVNAVANPWVRLELNDISVAAGADQQDTHHGHSHDDQEPRPSTSAKPTQPHRGCYCSNGADEVNLDEAGRREEQLIWEAEASQARMVDVPGRAIVPMNYFDNAAAVGAQGDNDEFVHSVLVDQNYFMVTAHMDNATRRKIINGEYVDFARLLLRYLFTSPPRWNCRVNSV